VEVADSSDILHKLEGIEKEITAIKLSILKKLTPTRKKVVSLKGIIKGVDITDDDIAFTQHSLYSKIKV
jgi:transcription elongation factor